MISCFETLQQHISGQPLCNMSIHALESMVKDARNLVSWRRAKSDQDIYSIASRIPPGQTCASCLVYELLVLHLYATSWVKVCSEGDLGDLWGCPGLAGGPYGVPGRYLGMPGRTLGSLGIPGASLGIPWVGLGGSLGVPGMPLGVPGGSLGGPWASLGLPRDPPGLPRDPQGTLLGCLGGPHGRFEKH